MGQFSSSLTPSKNIYIYESRLLRAVSRNDMKTFWHLLDGKKVDIDQVEHGHSALNLAMHRRNDQAVVALLESSCNIDLCGEDHFVPPLLQAVMAGHEQYVRLLVKHGCEVNIQGLSSRCSAAHVAAFHFAEHPKTMLSIVEFLVASGLNVNLLDENDETMLHVCAKHEGLGELLKYIINEGICDLNSVNEDRRSAIHKAILSSNRVSLHYLIGTDCDLNLRDCDGYTPIGLGLNKGQNHLVEILLEQRARIDVNVANNSGTTPLHEIILQRCSLKDTLKFINLLLECGACVNQQDNNHNSCLHLAARQGDVEVCKLLLENNADHGLVNKEGKAPLYLAASCGCDNVIRLLLDFGVDVNLSDRLNKTPLYAAVYMGQQGAVKVLLKAKADVNTADAHGRTPLFVATKHGRHSVAESLLNHNANPNLLDTEGKGPLHMAIVFPKLDFPMIKLLLDAGCDPVNLDSFLVWVMQHLKIHTDDLNVMLGDWLDYMRKNPKSLKHICRVTIRKWIRTNVTPSRENLIEAVSTVPLPPSLKYYLYCQDL